MGCHWVTGCQDPNHFPMSESTTTSKSFTSRTVASMLEPIVETKDYCQNELATTSKECVVSQGYICLNTECIDFMYCCEGTLLVLHSP